jgi:two-component system response regulator AtoC
MTRSRRAKVCAPRWRSVSTCISPRTPRARWTLLESESFDVMLTDFKMPNEDGMKLIARAKSLSKPPICILMTAYGSEELAVDAMKRGADDYIAKGRLQIDELEMRIARACGRRSWRRRTFRSGSSSIPSSAWKTSWANRPPMQEVFDTVQQVAPTRATVLILGESGTGKEMIAKAIHQLSPRAKQPLVSVHCAALSATLLESELFGHERARSPARTSGGSVGSSRRKGGTLFLDEIGEIDARSRSSCCVSWANGPLSASARTKL